MKKVYAVMIDNFANREIAEVFADIIKNGKGFPESLKVTIIEGEVQQEGDEDADTNL